MQLLKGKWNVQALVKNSTDAMKDSRVVDFVNTVSPPETQTTFCSK